MSVEKVSLVNAEHYTWDAGCDGWHLVNQPSLSVIRERMPPGAAEVRHFHHHARQFFYVLSGSADLEADGVTHQLDAGEGLEVAPGTAHRIRNTGDFDLAFLVVSQPHSHGDRELA